MKAFLFSIIVPTYNRAHLIVKTLHSILEQSFRDFEVIVVDDGSTDNTEEVLQPFLSEKVRYYKITNGERARARNFGIKQAQGMYISFVDSDDLLYPNYFYESYQFLQNKPDAVFWALSYEIKNTKGKTLTKQIHKGDLRKKLQYGNFLSCMGVFVKKDILLKHPFNEDRDLSGTEDYELWLRLASRYPLYGIPTICACMINHHDRSVLQINEEKLIKRKNLLIATAYQDEAIRCFYGRKGLRNIKVHSFLYIALHLAMAKKIKKATAFLIKASKINFKVIFSYKWWVIIKKLLYGS